MFNCIQTIYIRASNLTHLLYDWLTGMGTHLLYDRLTGMGTHLLFDWPTGMGTHLLYDWLTGMGLTVHNRRTGVSKTAQHVINEGDYSISGGLWRALLASTFCYLLSHVSRHKRTTSIQPKDRSRSAFPTSEYMYMYGTLIKHKIKANPMVPDRDSLYNVKNETH